MKKAFIGLLILILSAWAQYVFSAEPIQLARMNGYVAAGVGGGCSTTWNDLTSFRLDFNQSGETTACLASGTEVGTYSSGAGTATPALVSPGSGGKALYCNGSNEYITFHNTGPYFRSTYGTLRFKFKQDANPSTQRVTLLSITAVAAEDRMAVSLEATGIIQLVWEDNNGGGETATLGSFDMDNDPDGAGAKTNYYGVWVQIEVKWDTTIGSNEVALRFRADVNDDGDFNDGGNETWSAYTYISGSQDIWASEPTGSDEINFGCAGTYEVDIWVDDLEISYNQP